MYFYMVNYYFILTGKFKVNMKVINNNRSRKIKKLCEWKNCIL